MMMDKAGLAFLILICVLVALALSILAFGPGPELAPAGIPAIVTGN